MAIIVYIAACLIGCIILPLIVGINPIIIVLGGMMGGILAALCATIYHGIKER